MRVLLVEDDPSLAGELRLGLSERGHAVDVASTAAQAEALARGVAPDAIFLDLRLPDVDGFELCRRLRRAGVTTAIIMLTGMGDTAAKVRGLDAGADDFVVKPADVDELCARMRAVTRRMLAAAGGLLTFEDLEMDLHRRTVTRAGRPIRLTPKEFALLEHFVRNPERVLTRAAIGQSVWDLNFDPESNVIEVFISAIRRKLGPPRLIHTVQGAGYVLSRETPAG